jgi:hypothetical protein
VLRTRCRCTRGWCNRVISGSPARAHTLCSANLRSRRRSHSCPRADWRSSGPGKHSGCRFRSRSRRRADTRDPRRRGDNLARHNRRHFRSSRRRGSCNGRGARTWGPR